MSHTDQINFVKEFKNFYINNNFKKDVDILEIGSFDVNGNMRNLFDFCKTFSGVDLVNGPNVDIVMNGSDIDKLNKKFDIIISCECFEHAKNWSIIFEKMCNITKEDSFIIFSVASTGRIEHGTERSGNWQSPGNKDDYYLNLNKKDFTQKFDLNKLFSNHFFFYNVNSFDLYFVGIKGFEHKKNSIDLIYKQLIILFKKKKIRKLLIYFYASIINETLRQDIFFFKKKLKYIFFKLLKIK